MSLVPIAPVRNLTLLLISHNSVELSWNPPFFEYQNGVIVGYNITVEGEHMLMFTTRSTNISLKGLKPHTTYSVSVVPYTLIGSGPINMQ